MTAKRRNMAIYAGKLMSAVLLCYLLSLWVSRLDYIWALISAVLVMSPEGKDAQELSLTRIKGNILGCLVGVLFLFAALENPVNIIAGAFVSLMLCYAFKLVAGARSTLVALIITLMHTDSVDYWGAAATRVGAVVAGCAIALLVTYAFHSRFGYVEEDDVKPV